MLRSLTLSLLLTLCSSTLLASELEPFQASYTADWSQLPISGKAERSLKQNSDGTWLLNFSASMMVAGIKESSQLRVVDSHIQPVNYLYQRTGLGKARKRSQEYNWSNLTLNGIDKNTPYSLTLKPGMLDKSSYQLALQRDVAAGLTSMSYTVADDDDLDTYDFRVLGEEILQTPLGKLRSVKVERVRDPSQSKRRTAIWFASDWNYLLVQLQQVEKDGKEYIIVVEDASVDGKPVTGLRN